MVERGDREVGYVFCAADLEGRGTCRVDWGVRISATLREGETQECSEK
jgi:hypothetical protein